MSELIVTRHGRTKFQRKLLTTVSTLVLSAAASSGIASAEGADHPAVWIELGGQMEFMQGASSPFTPPFLLAASQPAMLVETAPIDVQRAPRFALGLEGKVTFQPESSDWIFSAAVRYGRSKADRHVHLQSHAAPPSSVVGQKTISQKYVSRYADAKTLQSESHTVLDFTVGRDVGLGLLGKGGSSTVNLGVRFAQFNISDVSSFSGRPNMYYTAIPLGGKYLLSGKFDQFLLRGESTRSFRGIGPQLSWDASTVLLGQDTDGELTLDWGINAALLFGRQKANVTHKTTSYHYSNRQYALAYQTGNSSKRSHSVVVPNVGGFVGFSARYPNAKISFGYRGDFFLGAVDTGIDVRHSSNLGFHGPFASISIGVP